MCVFMSYVYDVNNVYLYLFNVHFPDIQTPTGGGECSHIVQVIIYGNIQRIPSLGRNSVYPVQLIIEIPS